jgi:manganese/zinc/iron transport system permease protein
MTWELLSETLRLEHYNTRLVVFGVAFLGATAGLVGSFLLLRKQSLLGDALSHATLPGIGIAFAVMAAMGLSGKSLPGLLIGATITGLLGVLLVLAIRKTTRLKDDAAMGIVLSVFFGLGVAILKMVERIPGQSAAGLDGFIYGKTASMIWSDFVLIALILLITIIVTIAILKELTLLCFDADFASAQGWPYSLARYYFNGSCYRGHSHRAAGGWAHSCHRLSHHPTNRRTLLDQSTWMDAFSFCNHWSYFRLARRFNFGLLF